MSIQPALPHRRRPGRRGHDGEPAKDSRATLATDGRCGEWVSLSPAHEEACAACMTEARNFVAAQKSR
jgi:hypothetical protein